MTSEQDVRSSDNGALVGQAPLIRTLRLKVRPSVKSWLDAAAVEVNQCWNWANATSAKAAQPFVGRGRWLSSYDLDRLSAGATEYFEHIGADTIQKVNAEFVTRRRQFHKVKLRWRASRGSKRVLGWVPFKSASLRRRGKYLRFCGKSIRVFEADRLKEVKRWRDGCFAQDAVGDWWLCLPVGYGAVQGPAAPREAVGIDLGLKDTATTSDADRLQAGRYYRDLEPQIAQAQRRGHRRQAKRLHRRATRRRAHALHQFSRRIIDQYQFVYIGDVSAQKLTQTRMAKSVLDTGWSMLKTQLLYKSQAAGRCVAIVDERNTTRVCSSCEALTGPRGLDKLGVRSWECRECGVVHDRDVNAARNILKVGLRSRAYSGSPPSVSGNESRRSKLPPSQTSRRCEARTATKTEAA
jgi:putative transposase